MPRKGYKKTHPFPRNEPSAQARLQSQFHRRTSDFDSIGTSEYFRPSSTPTSGRRSAKATGLKYSEAATASRLSRPPVPPPTMLTVNWLMSRTQELKQSRSQEVPTRRAGDFWTS